MLATDGALFVLELCLLVYCVLNAITTPDAAVRNLPKIVWLVLIVLVPWVGPICWLLAGRPTRGSRTGGAARAGGSGRGGVPPEYDRPGRARASNPDDDEAFLRGLRDRAQEQRRKGENPPPAAPPAAGS